MAIKVNGTTVIDDSRNLVNIASGAGSSTTYGDVGTYILGLEDIGNFTESTTIAGSDLYIGGFYSSSSFIAVDGSGATFMTRGNSVTGTWRRMARSNNGTTDFHAGLYVRIS